MNETATATGTETAIAITAVIATETKIAIAMDPIAELPLVMDGRLSRTLTKRSAKKPRPSASGSTVRTVFRLGRHQSPSHIATEIGIETVSDPVVVVLLARSTNESETETGIETTDETEAYVPTVKTTPTVIASVTASESDRIGHVPIHALARRSSTTGRAHHPPPP